jgi:hypothetical protein
VGSVVPGADCGSSFAGSVFGTGVGSAGSVGSASGSGCGCEAGAGACAQRGRRGVLSEGPL